MDNSISIVIELLHILPVFDLCQSFLSLLLQLRKGFGNFKFQHKSSFSSCNRPDNQIASPMTAFSIGSGHITFHFGKDSGHKAVIKAFIGIVKADGFQQQIVQLLLKGFHIQV